MASLWMRSSRTGSFHEFGPRIRRTEVRPTRTRRAISDLLTRARCSFWIPAVCRTAVVGRPSRLLFCRAWARPARVRSRRISLSNSAKIASKPAIARPAGVVRSSSEHDGKFLHETFPLPDDGGSVRLFFSELRRDFLALPSRNVAFLARAEDAVDQTGTSDQAHLAGVQRR